MKPDERGLLLAVYEQRDDGVFVDQIASFMSLNDKRAQYILHKWSRKGWWEYGVSLRSGWLTPEGLEAAKDE